MFRLRVTQYRRYRTQILKTNQTTVPLQLTQCEQWARALATHSSFIPTFHTKCEPPRYLYGLSSVHYKHRNYRNFSTSLRRFEKEPLKPSSKVESTVETIKKDIEDKEKHPKAVVPKKSLTQRIKEELIHYYHGFRLFGVEMRISSKLVFRILKGESLTRREHRLLVKTSGDIIRMIPFIVFLVVPFLEFALPIFIKLFPNMLPSTFESKDQRDAKYRNHFKAKLEVAKFFQETLDEMAPQAGDRHSELAKEFSQFFTKLKTSGDVASSKDIMKFSKLFEDEITLDSLQRPHLVALCRVLNVSTIGTSAMLRFNLRMKLRSLAADDKMIAKEGVDSLNFAELQQACKARGMRAYGITEERLRKELKNWLDLSLNEKVPQSLLLLSRALMVPDNVAVEDKLKATISALPDNVVTQTKAAIGEKEGKVDFKAKVEAIKLEEAKIKEEQNELKEAEEEQKRLEALKREKEEALKREKEEILQDKAPVISSVATPELRDPAPVIQVDSAKAVEEGSISNKDIEVIEDAIENIAKTKKSLVLEKESLQDLKAEMSDYSEDVQELQDMVKSGKADVKLTKGARRLYRAVNSMISKMDKVLGELEAKEQVLKKTLETATEQAAKQELVHIDELMSSIKSLQKVPDEAKLKLIQDILGRLDDDFDGQLKVDDVLKVVEMVGNEHVKLSEKQMAELIELLDKEEILEVESKIQKALDKAQKDSEPHSVHKSLFEMIQEADKRRTAKPEAGTEPTETIRPTETIVPKQEIKPGEKRPE